MQTAGDSLSVATLIMSLLSGAVGGGAVALLDWYLRQRTESSKNIQQVYVEQGIVPVRSAISFYGRVAFQTTLQVSHELDANKGRLEQFCAELLTRRPLRELGSFEIEHAYESSARLHILGYEFANMVHQGLLIFSEFTSELTRPHRLRELVGKPQRHDWLVGSAKLTQHITLFLEYLLQKLEDELRASSPASLKSLRAFAKSSRVRLLRKEAEAFQTRMNEYRGSFQEPDVKQKKGQDLFDFLDGAITRIRSLN